MGRFSLAALVCLALAAAAGASEAERQFKLGRKAEKAGRDVEAFLHYQRARAEEPSNRRFIDAAARLRSLSMGFLSAVDDAGGRGRSRRSSATRDARG